MEPAKSNELKLLVSQWNDEGLDLRGSARLNELLLGDPEACDVYLNCMAMEAQLERETSGAAFPVPLYPPSATSAKSHVKSLRKPIESQDHEPRWMLGAYAMAVAAAVIFVVAGIGVWFSWGTSDSQSTIATVLLAEDCVWAPSEDVKEGSRLALRRLSLKDGLAIVRLDSGTEIVMRRETHLHLISAVRARLDRGSVVLRSQDTEASFRLDTPESALTDLGAEFAVTVESTGATEVHVLDGEVACQSSSMNDKPTVLGAGQAMRIEGDRQAPRYVSLNSPTFSEIVKQKAPRERRDLMSVYEGFQYEEGEYDPSAIRDGKGWAGPWRMRRDHEVQRPVAVDTSDKMSIVHGRLTVPWPVAGGSRGMLEMPAGLHFRIRPMAKSIDLRKDDVVYFSLMTLEAEHRIAARDPKLQEGIRLTFRSSEGYWGDVLSFGIDQWLRPKIMTHTTGAFVSPASLADEQSLLWIGKIISRATGEDEVSFRIYGQADSLDFAEPAIWHCASRGLSINAALDLVVLSSTGTSSRIVDELRIGPTWRSVVPIRSDVSGQANIDDSFGKQLVQ